MRKSCGVAAIALSTASSHPFGQLRPGVAAAAPPAPRPANVEPVTIRPMTSPGVEKDRNGNARYGAGLSKADAILAERGRIAASGSGRPTW